MQIGMQLSILSALVLGCSSSEKALVYGGPATFGAESQVETEPEAEPVADQTEDDPPPTEEEPEEEEPVESGLAKWTVLVYLNGDNNLEENALVDMNELEEVGSTDDVHLLVQLDRSRRYSREDGNWSGARRYRAERDSNRHQIGSEVLVELGSVDSGVPETFVDFISWGVENFPAEHYAFIIWDHGWGWDMTAGGARKGVSSDDGTGNWISIAGGDLEQIVSQATDLTGSKLALVGMDACLMANWEVATVVAPYAEVYVASQATESLDGWAYHTAFGDLVADPEMDSAELGTVIAQRFIETRDSTQSVVELVALEYLNRSIDGLALEIMEAEVPRDAVLGSARRAQTFDGDVPDRDLGDLTLLLSEADGPPGVADAAADVWDELQGTVIANYTYGEWVRHATGLSIYLPTSSSPDPAYGDASWAELTHWDELLLTIAD
jgi:hypothetical protein